ncbi:MAG: peptidylprolyl isomerase [Gammaproteobacteria bacterium]|nr:peptidylprolyl isomerase [Gammaproteobacteria bacterium]
MGDIDLALDSKHAPLSTKNFMDYVHANFYSGTVFHRVIDGFMIQGGGWTTDLNRKDTNEPVLNEADNGLKNRRGTIALARTMEPHSATSQFFINVSDNNNLDHQSKTTRGWGYAVFGQVINGMDVVDKIKQVPTGTKGMMPQDAPIEDIIINAVNEVNCASLK